MREHDARLAPAAVMALVTSAIAGPRDAWVHAAAGAALVAALALVGAVSLRAAARSPARVRWRTARDVVAALAFAAAVTAGVAGAAAWRQHLAAPSEVYEAFAERRQVEVVGVVSSDPEPLGRDAFSDQPRSRFVVEASQACASPCGSLTPVRMSIEVVVAGAPPRLGDAIAASGAGDTTRDNRRQGRVWADSWVPAGSPSPALAAADHVREAARSAARGLPEDVRALTLGMVTGDTRDMSALQTEEMRVAGLTHLTAVSGSHFAMVTLAAGWALRRALARASLAHGLATRLVRAALLAAGMVALAVVVLPEPSVQRALTMALALAFGWACGRPARAIPALGAGVIVLLLADPGLGAAVGLQLSVTAVVAIVVWSPRLAVWCGTWLVPPAATAVAVPLSAWLACWPLLTALRPGIGLYTVPANLVAIVAAFPVTLIGLAATVVALVWPAGGAALMHVAGLCAWPVAWSAQAFAAAPGAWISWPDGPAGVGLACVVVALAVTATMAQRLASALRLGAALVAAAVAGVSPAWLVPDAAVTDEWAVVVCDVGQGDAMLVRVDSRSAVVIDTGPPGGAGADCLDRYGVESVPLLVLTHPHADHDGAVAELAAVARIEQAWVSPAATTPGHDAGVSELERLGIAVRVPAAGEVWEGGAASLTVVHPSGGLRMASNTQVNDTEVNDASLAVWIESGGVTALALGDLELAGQEAVADALGRGVVVDLVKVAHHGSGTQSERLAGLVTAKVAALSAGKGNPYGHPHPFTEALYAARALRVVSTADCGDIALTSAGELAARCPADVAG